MMDEQPPRRVNEDDTALDESLFILYRGALFTGEVVETDDEGTVIRLNTYRDGREDGPQREWFSDGMPRSEYRAGMGLPVGESRDWHPNGRLARRQEFGDHGVLRKREVWDENGIFQEGQGVDTW